MANFYKGNKNVQFQLVDLNSQEDFSVWKAWDKRSEEMKDAAGNVMKFPIKTGQLTGKSGKVYELNDVKFMKRVNFDSEFPGLNKQTVHFRNVLVGGVPFVFQFKQSANSLLLNLIETVKNMGQNPLSVVFEQTHNPSASPAQQYGMKITRAAVHAEHFVTPQMPQQYAAPNVGAPIAGLNVVSPREKEIIDAIKSVHTNTASEAAFVQILVQNQIPEARAKVLFAQSYK